jgi:CheY-like chemotaxis protein
MTRTPRSTATTKRAVAAPCRVLIVEDFPPMAILLGELLVFMGRAVVGTATTEEEAVAAAAQCRPDLLLMDVQLREGSGLSALARILARRHVPHVIMSGSLVDPGQFGPNSAVLRKPFSDDELQHAMQRVLEAGPSKVA